MNREVKIYNRTKGVTLFEKGKILSSFFERAKGLIGKKELREEEAFVFFSCNWIHTLFMSIPIGIIYVSKDFKVVKILSAVPPNRILAPVFRASITIECKSSLPEKLPLEIGDFLEIIL